MHFLAHRRLNGSDAFRNLLLHLAQLVELHFAADIRLDIRRIAAQAAEQYPRSARHPGQTFGTNDDQGDDGNDHQFGKTDIKHGLCETWNNSAMHTGQAIKLTDIHTQRSRALQIIYNLVCSRCDSTSIVCPVT